MAAVDSKDDTLTDDDSWLYGDSDVKHASTDVVVNGGTIVEKAPEPAVTAEVKVAQQEDGTADDEDDDDDDDDVQVTIGEIKPVVPDANFKGKSVPGLKPVVKGVDVDAEGTINGVPTYEFDINSIAIDEQPWRKPGADITDFFNYGFTEATWASYCNKQNRLRMMTEEERRRAIALGSTTLPPTFNPPPPTQPIKRDPTAISVIGSTAKDSRRPIEMPLAPQVGPPMGQAPRPAYLGRPPPDHPDMIRMFMRPPGPLPVPGGMPRPPFNLPPNLPPTSMPPRPALLPVPMGVPPSYLPPPPNSVVDPFFTGQPPHTESAQYPFPPYTAPFVAGSIPSAPPSWDTQSVASDYPRDYGSPARRSPSVSGSDDEYGGRYGRGRYYDRDRDQDHRRRRDRSVERDRSPERDRSVARERSELRERDRMESRDRSEIRERSKVKDRSDRSDRAETRDRSEMREHGRTRERSRSRSRMSTSDDRHKSSRSRKYRSDDDSDHKSKHKKSKHSSKKDNDDKADDERPDVPTSGD